MKRDTIHVLSGYKNNHGTVNEFYLLDVEGYLIDLELLYDYMPVTGKKRNYNSRERTEYKKKGLKTDRLPTTSAFGNCILSTKIIS